jgi:hypothetical protein
MPGGPKRNADQRTRDRAIVAFLYLQNQPVAEIVRYLNARLNIQYSLTRTAVDNDIAAIHLHWQDNYLEHWDEAIKRELNEIEILMAEAYDAWHKSKEPKTRRHGRQVRTGRFQIIRDPATGAELERIQIIQEIVETTEEQRDPNPQFLMAIIKLKERRAKILGLDQPDKTILVSGDAEISLLSLMDKSVLDAERHLIEIGVLPDPETLITTDITD